MLPLHPRNFALDQESALAFGMVSLVHQHGQRYTVESMTLNGATIAVVTLAADEVRLIRPNEIAHVRELVAAP